MALSKIVSDSIAANIEIADVRGITAGDVTINTSTIHLGNSTVNTTIHSTGITANGFNIHSVNANNITHGTISADRLPTSGVTANVYGNTTAIPVITIDDTGRVTNASTSSVSGVTGLSFESSNNTLTVSTSTTDYTANIQAGLDQSYTNAISAANTLAFNFAANAYANATSYTDSAVANLVNSAPAALDTLNELAQALGNDASFSTTVTTGIGNAYTNAYNQAVSLSNTAYSNATSYADTIAGTAYSNAVSVAASTYLPLAGGALTGALEVEGGNSSWGDVRLSGNSGWGSTQYPTLGSSNTSQSLIMLHNPHIPFRTENAAGSDGGRAGIRCAIDTGASGWWDIGVYGDAFHIYRNASSSRLFYIDSSGNNFAASSFRAPIFYDSNNTAYYTDPASTSQFNAVIGGLASPTGSTIGNIRSYGSSSAYMGASDGQGRTAFFGVDASGYAMFGALTNHDTVLRANNTEYLRVHTAGYTTLAGSARSPIFYDSNDTGYLLDPNSTSNSALRIRGGTLHGPNPTWGAYLYVGTDGRVGSDATVCVTNGNLHLDCTNGYDMYLNWYSARPIQCGSNSIYAGAYFYTSDRKYKKDIAPLSSSLISQLIPVRFKWIKDDREDVGFIAQDVEKVIPEAVVKNVTNDGDNEEEYLTLRDTAILAHLVKAVQELDAKYQDRINALEQEIKQLRGQ